MYYFKTLKNSFAGGCKNIMSSLWGKKKEDLKRLQTIEGGIIFQSKSTSDCR
jgi:hypothetical protein